MKCTLAIFLVCLIAGLATRQTLAEDARSTELLVNTAEISQIEFNTASGGLSFTAANRRYILVGRSVGGGFNDASVAANLAILNELRHAAKVTLWVRPSTDPQQPSYLTGLLFNYDSLK